MFQGVFDFVTTYNTLFATIIKSAATKSSLLQQFLYYMLQPNQTLLATIDKKLKQNFQVFNTQMVFTQVLDNL